MHIRKENKLPTEKDKKICTLFDAADQKGMELLFDSYYRLLVNWANTFLNDIQKSEDLVQELFVDIWENKIYRKFKPETLSSFLRLLVRNRSLNKKKAQRDLIYYFTELEQVEIAWDDYNDRYEIILSAIHKEIALLPPRSRNVIKEIFIGGLKYREVAEKFNISVSTVKSLVTSAMARLRERLGDQSIHIFWFWAAVRGHKRRFRL